MPTLATTDLAGVTVLEVVPRGKHQLFRFDNDYTLHTHFRMDGTWRTFPRGRRWSGGEPFQIRAVLRTATHDAVGYRLPVVELLPTAEEESVVGHLGPDLLGPDWDRDEALRRIRSEPDRSVGEALLDQRNLAGIGTFYRAEVLFLQGIHPRTPVADVPRSAPVGAAGPAADDGQPWPSRAVDDRRSAVRSQRVRVRAPGPAVPALRHPDPDRGVRTARSGAAELLVPALPAGPDGQRCSVSSRTARSSTLRETSDSTMTARRCARSKPTKLA